MKIPEFHSALARFLHGVVELRQALGYGDRSVISHLAHFDRFLVARGRRQRWLTRESVEDWASSDGPIKPYSRARRLQSMRILGRFIAQTCPKSYIPGPAWGPRQASSFRPHIYTTQEIDTLLCEAAKLTPIGSLSPQTYIALLSLLYSTGLRISEALALTLSDANLDEGTLIVRESKFHKSRAVPLHPTSAHGLATYRHDRDARGCSRDSTAPFFVNERREALRYPLVCCTFLGIARRTGIRKPPGCRGPRIHDLRHTFAVHRLLAWYRDGGNVQARLPLLATYLGHVSMISTQVYLEITSELLQEAARRFTSPQLKPVSTKAKE
jgi:site-specific recombinase XerD